MPHSPVMRHTGRLFLALVLGLLPALAATAQPMPADERRTLAAADFGRFETLGAVSLSPDGAWAGVVVPRVEEDGEVRIHRVVGGEPRVVANGARVEFSPGGGWVVVVVQPSATERERSGGNRGASRNDLVLHQLGTDEEERIEGVQAFSFSPDGAHLFMRRYRQGGNNQDHGGSDLVVRELATGVDVNFGNVAEAAWASEGALLALVTDAAGMAGNGLRLFEAGTGRIRTLRSESARFTSVTWRDDSTDLALMRVDPDSIRGDTVHSVLAWRDVGRDGGTSPVVLDGAVAGGSHGVVTARGLRWATDGSRLFFGVREREPHEASDDGEGDEADEGDGVADEAAEPESRASRARVRGEDEAPGLEIWHARDVDPVPQQRVRANQERNRSHLAAWPLAGEPVLLGGGQRDEAVTLLADERVAILSDAAPYAADRMFGPIYQDIYRIDLDTGARTPVAERVEHGRGVSPGGRWYLHFMDDQYWIHDLETGTSRSLTGDVPATFTNEQVDVVVPQKPPYGVAGWTEGDEYVLLYDRYDIWRIRPDGAEAERLTEGAAEALRHRIVRVGDDEPFLPREGPWWVSLYGDVTKQFGYGRLVPGAGVERLVLDDRNVGRLSRADDADVFAWITQRYDEPPALHVGDGDLARSTRVLGVNEFVADEFLWGRSELVEYENEWGVPLQGILTFPADFEPGRRYPMVVYHYERLSQGLHSWVNPSQRSAYNVTAFSQAGYFVLRPDIVYRPRNPGLSFMESVLPALDAALATGHIDPERVGILGHSWGGYQTTFAVTQTDRFAAAVAGAPLTNLVSMYLSFYWNTGSTDARIFEISQGRMEVPWWEDFESYRANSPVHHITEMRTPLLMAFGDKDGAVEFNQGVEFYNAARRANRDFVLLVYEGENHSLQQRPNQLDYYRRTHEWFAHYLKGEPAPAWITEGVPFLDQQEKLGEGPAAGRSPLPQ